MDWSTKEYRSYAEYAQKGYTEGCVVESRLEGTHGISLVKTVQGSGAFPDPPVPDFVIAYQRRGFSRGVVNLGLNDFDFRYTVRHFCIIPPQTATKFVVEGNYELYIVGIPGQWVKMLVESRLAAVATKAFAFETLQASFQRDDAVFQLVEQLHHPDTLEANNALLVDGLTMALVGRLFTLSQNALKRRDIPALDKVLLAKVESYMQDRLAENPTLDDLATLTGMSVYEFAKRFKTATGVSPYQYVLNERLGRAKTLVEDTRLTLAEVAYSVGFSSQAHMTKVFKARLGYTPKAYRKELS